MDGECDLAAVVYRETDSPDCVLHEFAQYLKNDGCRVAGLIQSRSESGAISVTALPTGDVICLAPDGASGSELSCIDTGKLIAAAEQIKGLIVSGADLVIINRFGRLEAVGKGLIQQIVDALEGDVPVIVAVPDYRFEEWLRFTCGMSVKLNCSQESILKWWRSLGALDSTKTRRKQGNFCGIFK